MEQTPEGDLKTVEFVVEEDEVGTRLDAFLSARLDISRSQLKRMFDKEHVSVNNDREKKSYRLELGDELLCQLSKPPKMDLEPRPVDFDVIHDEEEWLIVNKPPDLSVHPAPGQKMDTLVHGLLHRYPEMQEAGEEFRPGIVHRLDRFTSGLLIVAKTHRVHQNLTAQFASRLVSKEYYAVVEGQLEYDENRVEAAIARHSKQRERMEANPEGKASETLVVVEKRFKKHTSVFCFPKTGRRHQIRVHLSHLGHVIVGDASYGARVPVTENSLSGHPDKKDEKVLIPRLCLHARKLKFKHPLNGEECNYECPIPQDILNLTSKLSEIS